MTEIPGMILWTGDYLADTGHLTTFEHGAYLLILMAMWRNGGKLAKDSRTLALIAKSPMPQWKKIEPIIMDFMTVEEDHNGKLEITQKRLATELKLGVARYEKNKAAGRLGGIAKALKYKTVRSSDATDVLVPRHCNYNTNTNYKKESLNGELRQDRETMQIFVTEDTPQWNAWASFYLKSKGTSPPKTGHQTTKKLGWYFPTEWPPPSDG